MIKAKRLGLKVFEFNVIAQMREGGKSNVRGSTIQEFLINLFRYRFMENEAAKIPAVKSTEREVLPNQGQG
jgi:hypothetical protein